MHRTSYTLEKAQYESAIMEVTGICTCSCHFVLLMVLCFVFLAHTVILAITFSQHCGQPTQSNLQHSVKPTQLKAKPCVAINPPCVIKFPVSERRRNDLRNQSWIYLKYTLCFLSLSSSHKCAAPYSLQQLNCCCCLW